MKTFRKIGLLLMALTIISTFVVAFAADTHPWGANAAAIASTLNPINSAINTDVTDGELHWKFTSSGDNFKVLTVTAPNASQTFTYPESVVSVVFVGDHKVIVITRDEKIQYQLLPEGLKKSDGGYDASGFVVIAVTSNTATKANCVVVVNNSSSANVAGGDIEVWAANAGNFGLDQNTCALVQGMLTEDQYAVAQTISNMFMHDAMFAPEATAAS
ncbi:MAG: hypothetical protein ABIM99_06540 [Candidatus Dojkabacteria bacterium]